MPESVSNQRVREVRDPLAVDVLLQLTSARRLAPFMREEHTLGSAAAELGIPSSSLAYWVGRFRGVGLLEIVEQRRRAGKPIPVYRATADEFVIPLEAMPTGAREQFLHGGRRHVFDLFTGAVERVARRHFEGGLHIKCDPHRGVEIALDPPPTDRPVPVTEWWGTVSLTDAEAAALHRELETITSRYGRDLDEPGRKPYLMMVGLAPERRHR